MAKVTGDGACNIQSSDSRRWPDTPHLSELIAKYRDDKNSTDRDIWMNDTESPSSSPLYLGTTIPIKFKLNI